MAWILLSSLNSTTCSMLKSIQQKGKKVCPLLAKKYCHSYFFGLLSHFRSQVAFEYSPSRPQHTICECCKWNQLWNWGFVHCSVIMIVQEVETANSFNSLCHSISGFIKATDLGLSTKNSTDCCLPVELYNVTAFVPEVATKTPRKG